MKIRSTFHVLALLMAVLIFSMPVVTFAQQAAAEAEQRKAIADAERDAEARVNKGLWFGVGCLTTVIGTVLAYSLPPTPPAQQLVGKSPEYVNFYTEAYKAKAKSVQGRSALIGAGITLGGVAITYGAIGCLFASAAASVEVE